MSLLSGQTPAAFQSGTGLSAGQRAPPARRCRCPVPTTSTTSTTRVSARTWAGSDLTAVMILRGSRDVSGHPAGPSVVTVPVAVARSCLQVLQCLRDLGCGSQHQQDLGQLHRMCSALLRREPEPREGDLACQRCWENGLGWGQGRVQRRPGELLGAGGSSPSAPHTSPAPPMLSAWRLGVPGLWRGRGAQPFPCRRCLTACT